MKAATRHAKARREGLLYLGGYDCQFLAQNHGCAICGYAPKPGGRRLSLDHDHKLATKPEQAARGLLCARCNRAVGWLSDDCHRAYACYLYLRHGWRASVEYVKARRKEGQ